MLTYLFGPFLSLFPRPWRQALPFALHVEWVRAAAIGGFLEVGAALYALAHWYFYAMVGWIGSGMEAQANGRMGHDVTDINIASAAYTVWITHPITWLISYFVFEGTVRLCAAAFTGGVFGTLPLVVVDKVLFAPFRYRPPEPRYVAAGSAAGSLERPSSILDMICEWRFFSKRQEVDDEIFFDRIAGEDFLEIQACRKKKGWTPRRVVRVKDDYYRLEKCLHGSDPRPFCYKLRRLEEEAPGRTALSYAPPGAVSSVPD
jgi:hypothetical protein